MCFLLFLFHCEMAFYHRLIKVFKPNVISKALKLSFCHVNLIICNQFSYKSQYLLLFLANGV